MGELLPTSDPILLGLGGSRSASLSSSDQSSILKGYSVKAGDISYISVI